MHASINHWHTVYHRLASSYMWNTKIYTKCHRFKSDMVYNTWICIKIVSCWSVNYNVWFALWPVCEFVALWTLNMPTKIIPIPVCVSIYGVVYLQTRWVFFFKSDRFFANKDRAWLEWGCKGDVAPHGLNMNKKKKSKKKNTIPFLKSVMRFGLSVCELDKKLAL